MMIEQIDRIGYLFLSQYLVFLILIVINCHLLPIEIRMTNCHLLIFYGRKGEQEEKISASGLNSFKDSLFECHPMKDENS
jgi:hypothetical protein